MKKAKYMTAYTYLAFIALLAVLLFALPKQSYSQNEKHELADFPSFSVNSLLDGSYFKGIETYVSDHFPFRDLFVGINAYFNLYTGRNGANGVYKGNDGYLIAEPAELNEDRCRQNIKWLADFSDTLSLPSSLIIIPTPGYMLEDKLPEKHTAYHDNQIFSIAEEASDNMNFIDLRPVFYENMDNMQIYYKTDHHMTTAGSYLTYQAFCANNGFVPVCDFSNIETLTDFYGTNYSKSGLWLEKPDTVEIWHSANQNTYEVIIDDINKQSTYNSLYFYEHNENMDKYPVFLHGNHAIVTINNKSCQNGKRLLILKDSYAHCFATFACENYEEICMVDLRYYRGAVSDIISKDGINEILYLFGAENLAGLADIAWLK